MNTSNFDPNKLPEGTITKLAEKEDGSLDIYYQITSEDDLGIIKKWIKYEDEEMKNTTWFKVIKYISIVLANIAVYKITYSWSVLLRILLWLPLFFIILISCSLMVIFLLYVYAKLTRKQPKVEDIQESSIDYENDKLHHVKINVGHQSITWGGKMEIPYSIVERLKIDAESILVISKPGFQTTYSSISLTDFDEDEKNTIIDFLKKQNYERSTFKTLDIR